jgi:heme-degrading monooxygenase HmoA
MYGTVAQIKVKPGKETELMEYSRDVESQNIPGWISTYVYRMDNDPNEYYLTVVFESKEAYVANANSPEQDASYRRLRELLVSDPEWHDGEVVNSATA